MTAINIQKTFYKVADFISWQKAGTLVLSPDFQRRPVWKLAAKSYLIDTIIRGFPIPIIFLRDQRVDPTSFEPKREVIDGQQRLRTVIAYIAPSLLPDFNPNTDDFVIRKSHNDEFTGKKYSELPSDIQGQILEYQFNVHVLPSWVDDRDVLQIFRRMNSTSYSLKAQELRNATYFGAFKNSVYRLAAQQLSRWRKWKTFTEDDIARMLEVELTSEFAILMLRKSIMGRNQNAIGGYYKKYDPEDKYPEQEEVERRFDIVMEMIDEKLGAEMAYLPFGRQTVIYSLFAFFYDVLFGIESELTKANPNPVTPAQVAWVKLAGERIQSRNAPDKVLAATDRRTTNPIERKTLFEYLHNRFVDGK